MQAYLNTLGRKSLKTFITLMKIMLPVMILVRLGDQIGLTDWLGQMLVPVMSLVGLPPEAGLVWGISLLIGTYGGLGAYLTLLPGMEISVAQHSILCAMMLIAHMIPVEQAIVSRAGASFWITSAVRIGGALLFGAGDGVAQRIEERQELQLDSVRLFVFVRLGCRFLLLEAQPEQAADYFFPVVLVAMLS